MDNNSIIEYLADKICGKKIAYNNTGVSLTQSECEIYVNSSYTEGIHEIAHWIACDPKYRNEYNLGLPTSDICKSNGEYYSDNEVRELSKITPIIKRMFYEESIALCVTKFLFDKYINTYTNIEILYIEYLYGLHSKMSYLCMCDVDKIKEKASELFIEYTTNILNYNEYKSLSNG